MVSDVDKQKEKKDGYIPDILFYAMHNISSTEPKVITYHLDIKNVKGLGKKGHRNLKAQQVRKQFLKLFNESTAERRVAINYHDTCYKESGNNLTKEDNEISNKVP
jgi:hypothetical protein